MGRVSLGFAHRMGRQSQSTTPAAFDPATLFTGYDGAVFDASNLTNQYQTTDTSTPAVIGQPVGRAGNLVAGSENALQATAGLRPVLGNSGSAYWWLFDGIDDRLQADFGAGVGSQPCDLIVALRVVVHPANGFIVGGPTLGSNGSLYLYAGTTTAPTKAATAGTDYVVTCRVNGASSRMALDGGAYSTGNPGPGVGNGVAMGDAIGGGVPTNVRIHRLFFRFGGTVLTDAEIAQVVTWCAAGQGRVL